MAVDTKGETLDPREPIMRYFEYAHLPQHLQTGSKPFGELAEVIHATVPRSAERSAGLRKLLEAKDCIVRAVLPVQPSPVAQEQVDRFRGSILTEKGNGEG
jgi:hypothetical protein